MNKAQEGNIKIIKVIKVNKQSEGPNIDWAYLRKLHPTIYVICAVTGGVGHLEELAVRLVESSLKSF